MRSPRRPGVSRPGRRVTDATETRGNVACRMDSLCSGQRRLRGQRPLRRWLGATGFHLGLAQPETPPFLGDVARVTRGEPLPRLGVPEQAPRIKRDGTEAKGGMARERMWQTVRILGHSFAFRVNETIHTESSYKYSLDRFTALARGSGWTPRESWTDSAGMFSVHALVASD